MMVSSSAFLQEEGHSPEEMSNHIFGQLGWLDERMNQYAGPDPLSNKMKHPVTGEEIQIFHSRELSGKFRQTRLQNYIYGSFNALLASGKVNDAIDVYDQLFRGATGEALSEVMGVGFGAYTKPGEDPSKSPGSSLSNSVFSMIQGVVENNVQAIPKLRESFQDNEARLLDRRTELRLAQSIQKPLLKKESY